MMGIFILVRWHLYIWKALDLLIISLKKIIKLYICCNAICLFACVPCLSHEVTLISDQMAIARAEVTDPRNVASLQPKLFPTSRLIRSWYYVTYILLAYPEWYDTTVQAYYRQLTANYSRHSACSYVNSLRPGQNGWHFAYSRHLPVTNPFSSLKLFNFLLKFEWSLFLRIQLALVQSVAWHRAGNILLLMMT